MKEINGQYEEKFMNIGEVKSEYGVQENQITQAYEKITHFSVLDKENIEATAESLLRREIREVVNENNSQSLKWVMLLENKKKRRIKKMLLKFFIIFGLLVLLAVQTKSGDFLFIIIIGLIFAIINIIRKINYSNTIFDEIFDIAKHNPDIEVNEILKNDTLIRIGDEMLKNSR